MVEESQRQCKDSNGLPLSSLLMNKQLIQSFALLRTQSHTKICLNTSQDQAVTDQSRITWNTTDEPVLCVRVVKIQT